MDRTVVSRQTMISFGRGLFVLRYASCEQRQAPPRVQYAVAAGSTPGLRIVPMPGTVAGILHQVGDLAVIASEGPGALEVRVEETRPGAGVDCSLALDRLGGPAQDTVQGQAQGMNAAQNPTPAHVSASQVANFGAPLAGPTGGVSAPFNPVPPAPVVAAQGVAAQGVAAQGVAAHVMAHVSYRGDVTLGLGEWIGGPQAPSPIEGLAIMGAEAAAAGLEYQVITVGTDRWSDWVRAGSYAGSRGQGRPLRGVRLRVPQMGDDSLRAGVLFLGAPIAEKAGRTLEFMSGSPFDAMVGFRIELVREAARDGAPMTLAVPEASASRLKVFRSSRA